MVVSGKMYAKKAGQGYFNADYPGTERYTFSGMNGSFEGMGAYNNTRKSTFNPLQKRRGTMVTFQSSDGRALILTHTLPPKKLLQTPL